MISVGGRVRSVVALLLALLMASGPVPPVAAQEPAALEHLSAEDGVQFAVKWAQFGAQPDASVLVDTAIGVMSVGFPPAGAAMAVAWGFIKAMTGGPDPVFEALKALNARLDAHERAIVSLQTNLNAFRTQVFQKWDIDRLEDLRRTSLEVKSRTAELRMRPTDPVMKRRIVEDARNLAARFSPAQEGELPQLWQWSDTRVRIEKGRVTLGPALPPDFKVLPAFDHYVNALVLLMAAIEYESGGNAAYIRRTYGEDLLSHARFLSVRPLWREVDPPRTLSEHVMGRISCGIQPVTKYPTNLRCRASYYCNDLMRRTTTVMDSREYLVDSSSQLCTYSPPQARSVSEGEQARRIEAIEKSPRYGSEAMQLWEQWGQWGAPRVHGQEDHIEEAYGVRAMAALADKLVRLATYGTLKEPEVGQFDFTFYKRNYLYALKPNGELLWYSHLVGVDRNPPKRAQGPGLSATPGAARGGNAPEGVTSSGQRSSTPSTGAQTGRFVDAPGMAGRVGGASKGETPPSGAGSQGQAPPPSGAATTLPPGARTQRDAASLSRPPGPRVTHEWEGPKLVATGWQGYRELIPAGLSGVYGLTADGMLRWYRHDGSLDGTVKWKGPVDVGRGGAIDRRTGSAGPLGVTGGPSAWAGWNSCQRIIAAGDGVLYCIGRDGALRWFRHGDAAEASARPSWYGPLVMGSGWGHFVHLFSTGEGRMYAVQPTGEVLWYWHKGYQTGQNIWEGPRQVNAGWANLRRILSPGAGVIYAVRADGSLLWYEHEGYRDGKAAWIGPAQIAADWGSFVQVFPRMWGTPMQPR